MVGLAPKCLPLSATLTFPRRQAIRDVLIQQEESLIPVVVAAAGFAVPVDVGPADVAVADECANVESQKKEGQVSALS